MARTLKRKYYAAEMEGLRASNPRNWWHSVKIITGQTASTTGLMNSSYNFYTVYRTICSFGRLFRLSIERYWPLNLRLTCEFVKTSKIGGLWAPFLRRECPEFLDTHFQIWLTSEHVAAFCCVSFSELRW